MSEPSLPDKVVALHARLDEARIAHAFGGALALAYYAEPRATIDIDLNVFVAPERYPEVRAGVAILGVAGDVDAADVRRDRRCRLWWGRTPLDLFFAYDEIHTAMRRQRRTVPFGDTRLPILAPEHLLVCKALYDRAKDWLDIDQMLACVPELDIAEVREWLARAAEPDDPRATRFERAVQQLLDG